MFYIGMFLVVYGIMLGIKHLCQKRWGFVGAVWVNRIILTIMMGILIVFNSTPQGDNVSQGMIYLFGVLWGFNIIVYNPWALPEIVKKRKELKDGDKNKPIY